MPEQYANAANDPETVQIAVIIKKEKERICKKDDE